MKKLLILIMTMSLFSFGVLPVSALPISYSLFGTLSGTYDGTPFTGKNFSLMIQADTNNIQAISLFTPSMLYGVGNMGDNPPVFSGPELTGSISINNVGVFTFDNPLFAYATSYPDGYFSVGTSEDILFDVLNPFFSAYQMNVAVNAMPVDFYLVGTAEFAVLNGTTPGKLTLADASSPLTFQAEGGVVPEPSTFVLLGAGLAGMIVMRKKSRVE